MTAYRIRDWSKHFENNRTRELKELRFVILPNKHDGDGYTELLDHPNGAAHYGAWVAIVQVASKCDVRGTLLRDGDRPHDPASLCRLTRLPEKVFREALPRLAQIGWIEPLPLQNQVDSEIPQESAGLSAAEYRTPPPESAIEQNGIEEKGIEEKKETSAAQARRVFVFWQEIFKHQQAAFDSKRERYITDRLKQGYTVEQLQDAARGCKVSRYHQGENESKTVYDRVDLIYRDAEHVDMFIAKLPQDNGGPKKPPTETEAERIARESCERCHATGTEIIPGRGARPCDHARVNSASSPIIGSAFEDCEARVS